MSFIINGQTESFSETHFSPRPRVFSPTNVHPATQPYANQVLFDVGV